MTRPTFSAPRLVARSALALALAVQLTTLPQVLHPAGAVEAIQWAEADRDADVNIFIKNNIDRLPPPQSEYTDQELVGLKAVLSINMLTVLALQLCEQRWAGFEGQTEEASRRVELFARVYIQYAGFPGETVSQYYDEAYAATFKDTRSADTLLYNLDRLYMDCQPALASLSNGYNYAQE